MLWYKVGKGSEQFMQDLDLEQVAKELIIYHLGK